MRLLKFDPFAMRISIVSWLKNNPTMFCFYKNAAPILPQNMNGNNYY